MVVKALLLIFNHIVNVNNLLMDSIIQFKTSREGCEVEYEIISLPDTIDSTSNIRNAITNELDFIESRIVANQDVINKLNIDIEKLTNNADGIDYTIAVASGIITGLIDAFFVGEFSLDRGTQWGKDKVDSFVKFVAKKQGYSGDSMEGAVKFLEGRFPIPADSATNIFGGGYYHHLRDFSHHPTPVGLIFSLLTQFTKKVFGTDTLGNFIVVDVPSLDLIGKDLPSKLTIGFMNWIFHMISDIAGSSGSIAKGKYGTGLPGPFVSLLKELSAFPFFSHKEKENDFCIWISKLFNGTLLSKRDENGKIIPDSVIKFDFRAELGVLYELGRQAIPVIINECIVRVSYFIRRLIGEFKQKDISSLNDFINKIDWKKTLPFNNRTIVRMMTIASGTFVAVDAADAAIRSALKSGGEPIAFLANMVLRINFVGMGRFVIAIGADAYMGYKKGKMRNERMYRQTEQIMLSSARLYYKQADMWISAEDANKAIGKMQEAARQSIIFMLESYNDIGDKLISMSQNRNEIENNNPNLLNDLSNLLKYGK